MSSQPLQILITVWVGAHPLTYTIPHQYPVTSSACQDRVNELFAQRRKGSYHRMTIECVPAVGSDA